MLELLKDNDKKLKRKSKKISKIDDSIHTLAKNLVETMVSNNGIGLAAPQCGIHKRIIVVLVNNEPRVMINPEVIFTSQENCSMEEGCLSFPGKFLTITRPEKITVKYRNLSGHPMLETHDGLTARILFHEIDHLDGIVFEDRVKND